mgnify:CR=1
MYKKWDILLINFPFSDFKSFKLRPVLLWKDLWNDILISLCFLNFNKKENYISI